MKSETRQAQNAALSAAMGAGLLAIIKLVLFFFTGSLIIALSAWDSTMDFIVSLVNRKIVKFSRLDADENHPYGHGRVESIAALAQGCLILGGSIAIMFSGVKQLFNESHTQHSIGSGAQNWGYVLFFIFATAVSFFIAKRLSFFGKKLNSPALLADSEHYRVDLVTNLASAMALSAVIIFKMSILDPIIAVIFAFYIVYGSINLLRTSINELMDHDIPPHIKLAVIKLIHSTNPKVIDVHKLRGRKTGPRYYFDCHVTLPSGLKFTEVHEIVEKIELTLESFYGGDMIIHADPDNVPKDH